METARFVARVASLGLAVLAWSVAPARASLITDFTGVYDVSNWTTTVSPNGSDASVNLGGAPLAISLASGNNGVGFPSFVEFTIASVGNGLATFSWSYQTNDIDGSSFDPFGYVLNGVFTQLTANGSSDPQNGVAVIAVSYGDVFGFRQVALDSTLGSAVTRVDDFSAPVPEPGTMILLGSGIAGLALKRRRQRAARGKLN